MRNMARSEGKEKRERLTKERRVFRERIRY
jgi:hypothetical protein